MKKTIATTAIAGTLVLLGTAHAQTNVTMYGLLDQAVDYNTNVDAAGHNRVWMPSLGGGMFPSRIGFKGSEDLGNGLQAIFTLETGVYVDTGTTGQGSRLFGRQAWVGLAGKWGQLTLGRNYNMLYNSMPEVEIIGPTQYGLGSIEPAIPNGRTDNSIAYRAPSMRSPSAARTAWDATCRTRAALAAPTVAVNSAAMRGPAASGRPCCATTPRIGA